jgi:putative addiction module killer protein
MGGESFTLLEYQDREGRHVLSQWRASIDPGADARIVRALARMAAGNPGDAKALGGGLYERRIDWGPGYRLYYARVADRVVVMLGGGTKRSQTRDIATARRRWADYQVRGEATVIRVY